MNHYKAIILTGIIGLIAALITGTSEFILHFDPLTRFETEYGFMEGFSDQRSTIGHFIVFIGGPLYAIGCWHIYLMLKPAHEKLARLAFFVMAYGFFVGVAWMSSRASISALANAESTAQIQHLIELYVLRYETLLTIVRTALLVFSGIFAYLVLTGRSHYPKWMAVFNPFVLTVTTLLVYLAAPAIGKYVTPIALNVGFSTFFILSLLQAKKLKRSD